MIVSTCEITGLLQTAERILHQNLQNIKTHNSRTKGPSNQPCYLNILEYPKHLDVASRYGTRPRGNPHIPGMKLEAKHLHPGSESTTAILYLGNRISYKGLWRGSVALHAETWGLDLSARSWSEGSSLLDCMWSRGVWARKSKAAACFLLYWQQNQKLLCLPWAHVCFTRTGDLFSPFTGYRAKAKEKKFESWNWMIELEWMRRNSGVKVTFLLTIQEIAIFTQLSRANDGKKQSRSSARA